MNLTVTGKRCEDLSPKKKEKEEGLGSSSLYSPSLSLQCAHACTHTVHGKRTRTHSHKPTRVHTCTFTCTYTNARTHLGDRIFRKDCCARCTGQGLGERDFVRRAWLPQPPLLHPAPCLLHLTPPGVRSACSEHSSRPPEAQACPRAWTCSTVRSINLPSLGRSWKAKSEGHLPRALSLSHTLLAS